MYYLILLFCSRKTQGESFVPMTMVANPEIAVESKGFDRERKSSDFRPPKAPPVSIFT
jgi:hypothetical protein